ncbi:MAG TPA: hypothetical protein VGN17_09190 [Bryobacteraceae bacterium]|jgi:hypothetical protein
MTKNEFADAPKAEGPGRRSKDEIIEFFEREIWPKVPAEVLGKPLSKQEREEILGVTEI